MLTSGESELASALQRFFAATGSAVSIVGAILPIPEGHAGLAHWLTLALPSGEVEAYVLKLGPAGVPRRGSADIYRQYPLLSQLRRMGLPVPNVPWASDDEHWVGAPFIVMERLPGKSLFIWEPGIPGPFEPYWLEAARLLARIHRGVDARDLLEWESPQTLPSEIDRWRDLIRHTADPADRDAAYEVYDSLQKTMPTESELGLIHGDFQPGNILFEDGAVSALIDWDLAGVGPRHIDLGWLLMMADVDAWSPSFAPKMPASKCAILQEYSAAGARVPPDVDWYHALACFRMAVITGMNVKLHRQGRRHDPIWDRFAPSAATLLARSAAILSSTKGKAQ